MVAFREHFKNPTTAELELIERFGRLPNSAHRDRNFEAFAKTGLPHRRVEAWKWSDVRQALPSLPDACETARRASPFDELDPALEFNFDADGTRIPGHLPEGIRILEQSESQALAGAEDLPVAALGAALSDKPANIIVEISKTPSQPIHLIFAGNSPVMFARIEFLLREGVSAEIYESHLNTGGFTNAIVNYRLEQHAELKRTIYQSADKSGVQVFTGLVQLQAGSSLVQSSLGFGAKLCRNETRVFHQGKGASAELNSAYLVGDGYHYDQTSHVRHSIGECETHQLTKGAVMDGGRAVFQGKFYVARRAQETAADMQHHALILENGGEVNAKPELEIYADDVECAHGNTVGALDAEALFYMRQRGMDERSAKALLTEAFVGEALGNAPDRMRVSLTVQSRDWLKGYL
ncbi:MAG: Fe-S cluster assembly protein SufD [Ponticaulis sp.]|nr:Fe-S cluster assembly protein SufD [Ponticaulis sp.]